MIIARTESRGSDSPEQHEIGIAFGGVGECDFGISSVQQKLQAQRTNAKKETVRYYVQAIRHSEKGALVGETVVTAILRMRRLTKNEDKRGNAHADEDQNSCPRAEPSQQV